MSDIKNKVFSGLIWKYSERMIAQIVTLIVSVILARILSPDEYSVVAIITVFITFANVFVTSGMGTSLVQKKTADEKDFSTIFIANIVFSMILYLILFFTAPFIASYYEMPILCPTLRVMAIQIIMTGINNVQQAYVNKRMEFKRFFFSTLAGVFSSAAIGIYMAYAGYGPWALVAQTLTNVVVNTIVLFFVCGWKPRFYFSWKRFKGLFNYGWKILATGLLLELNTEVRDLIIGKRYTPVDLSYVNKSKELPKAISTNINTTISSVVFPAMALYQDDREMLKKMSRKAIRTGTYVLAPLLFGLAAVARPLVIILLTEKWLPCVVYLRLMCVQYALQPVQTSSIQAMKAIGKSDTYLKLQVIKTIIGIVLLMLSVLFFKSPIYVVLATLIAEIASTIVNFPTNKREMNYGYGEQLADSFVMMLPSVAMFTVVYFMQFMPLSPWVMILLQIIVEIVIYFVISILLKIEEYHYIKGFVLDRVNVNK